jgi:hypothetical protein
LAVLIQILEQKGTEETKVRARRALVLHPQFFSGGFESERLEHPPFSPLPPSSLGVSLPTHGTQDKP